MPFVTSSNAAQQQGQQAYPTCLPVSLKHLEPSTTFIRGPGPEGELHGAHRSRGQDGQNERTVRGEETHSKVRRARFAVSLGGPGDLHRGERGESDGSEGSDKQRCTQRRSPPGRQGVALHLLVMAGGRLQGRQVLDLIGPACAGVSRRASMQSEATCDSQMSAPGGGAGLQGGRAC